ncbi:MAG: DMT family transporter [Candidatus Dormibacter sp.]|uniref:DMT family transporter n=1 Tax=Candidatus Dormibacter sp. TaxID=2973982 RepID=UPI000DB48BA7|nr:MAG: hypothetical protein DLM66_08930 [Candidatus Dormibacteraeota bacterium]
MASPEPERLEAAARQVLSGHQLRGVLYVVAGAGLWGLNGVVGQVVLSGHGISTQWLVMMRLAGAGLLLLLWFRPRFPRQYWRRLLVYGVLGIAAVQYTYFAAIHETNAATATFLQYTSIPMIATWQLLRGQSRLTLWLGLALPAATAGTLLLAAGGGGSLAVSPLGLVLGLLSAVTAAIYILASVPLIRVIGAWPTTTWGFVIGAVPLLVWSPPWAVQPTGNLPLLAALMVFVVLAGTLVAFGLFISSLHHISPTEAAIAGTAEPVVAAAAAYLILGINLRPLQYAGGALILVAVLLLRRPEQAT